MKLFFKIVLFALIISFVLADWTLLHEITAAHYASSVLHGTASVCIYNDGTKFVSGGKDNKVKIWSMADKSLLHTATYTDYITHVKLHPIDNRIFIFSFMGTISVLNPTTFAELNPTGIYPNSGNANNVLFNALGTKFYTGGYDGSLNPYFHVFDSTTYA
jgi:WD40 repeat protein